MVTDYVISVVTYAFAQCYTKWHAGNQSDDETSSLGLHITLHISNTIDYTISSIGSPIIVRVTDHVTVLIADSKANG